MAESEEELKSLLMKVKEESEKNDLKLNIQKTKIMASGPITSWKIHGETVETVSDFILGCFKIAADGDCSHEIKRHLLLRRKVMTNLDSILKRIWRTVWTFLKKLEIELPYDPAIPLLGMGFLTLRKPELKETRVRQCSSQHCLQ